MKGRSPKISPFTGIVNKSELEGYRDRLGNPMMEITAYADFGTRMIISLADHHQPLKDFLIALTQHDFAQIENEEKAEFFRQTQSVLEELVALFDFFMLASEGALDFPKPEA